MKFTVTIKQTRIETEIVEVEAENEEAAWNINPTDYHFESDTYAHDKDAIRCVTAVERKD